MAIPIEDLRVNDIVLAINNGSYRRCIVRKINNNSVIVDYLDMQTGDMVSDEVYINELEPVSLMESTLYFMGFKKDEVLEHKYFADKCYILKKNGDRDIIVIKKNNHWLLLSDDKNICLAKQELFLHNLQNYISNEEKIADKVPYDKFVELTSPFCVLPFEPREKG